MNVSTIEMPAHEARARLREYKAGLHRKADEEWKAVADGYEQLAKGRSVHRFYPSLLQPVPGNIEHHIGGILVVYAFKEAYAPDAHVITPVSVFFIYEGGNAAN